MSSVYKLHAGREIPSLMLNLNLNLENTLVFKLVYQPMQCGDI